MNQIKTQFAEINADRLKMGVGVTNMVQDLSETAIPDCFGLVPTRQAKSRDKYSDTILLICWTQSAETLLQLVQRLLSHNEEKRVFAWIEDARQLTVSAEQFQELIG
jgi:hypothetical protein